MFTLGDITAKRAKLGGQHEALVFEDVRLTYAQFHDRTVKLARALLARGLKPGDRLAVVAENSHRFMDLMFAAAHAGLVFTPLNFRLTPRELSFMLEDSGSAALFADDVSWELAQSVREAGCAGRPLFAIGSASGAVATHEQLIKEGADAPPLAVTVSENDLAALIYTGGTTGLPKGVMLTHRNLITSTASIAMELKYTEDDTTLMVLPMFHVAIWQVLCHLMVGARVVVRARADIADLLATIQRERCTNMNAVPTLYNWIVSSPELDNYDLSSLRMLSYGGSPFPEEVLRRCIKRFGPIFTQGYGLTEAAPSVSFLSARDHVIEGPRAKLLLSAGRELPLSEVRIGDADGNEVPRGQPGEVLVRGANVMKGYWNNENLTRERLRGGWLHTGDIGTMDDEGYIFLLDRKADMIVTGGENVYPTEIEAVLYTHPAVQECIVASAPDDKWGERVQAAVVLRKGAEVTERDLLAFCRDKLANYKCPKRIEFRDMLPKSQVGKLLRKDVRNDFWGGVQRQIR
ncbi:MAG TPA: long-chain-fatty-acid--CoA ligase [Ramlibacter sp.]|nr:long-chain-fatty-acid--CoA ligase [Ramlibacter sp.]